MKTWLLLAFVGLLGVGMTNGVETVFDCYKCSGKGCQGKPKTDSCPKGEYCYKMEVRRNEDVDNPFIIKGCTEDKNFSGRSCYDDCRENQQFGSQESRVCIYCCDDSFCNTGTRTSSTVVGVFLAVLTLVFVRYW